MKRSIRLPRKKTGTPTPMSRRTPWKVPSAVPKSEVRAHLAAIVRHAAAENEVCVGRSRDTAYSAFVSPAGFRRKRSSFHVSQLEVDIDELRRNWSRHREGVENSGRPLCILRKGKAIAMLIPTPRHQTMGIARVVLKEWREKQGYTGSPPDGPPRSRHGMWASSPKDREVKP
jgi:antitoxin (DNA-binding transcriptional repressor) of toxin-antitoxin stability system